ncbi:MAG: TA system VapC family ribonuclease toxin [Luteolibacter sp.]
MKWLCDSNVFLALVLGQHVHHSVAADWFGGLADSDTAAFCRATRISFLRLLTQKIATDYVPLTNQQAWDTLDRLMEDDAVRFESEPPGVDAIWRQLSEIDTASPKVWMDAYLAAFAICANLRLVTFDRDFRKFEKHSLDLLLLR